MLAWLVSQQLYGKATVTASSFVQNTLSFMLSFCSRLSRMVLHSRLHTARWLESQWLDGTRGTQWSDGKRQGIARWTWHSTSCWLLPIMACRMLQTLPEAQVTIYASKFGSDVTTHGAAGVWMPYKLSETPEVLTDRWAVQQPGHAQLHIANRI